MVVVVAFDTGQWNTERHGTDTCDETMDTQTNNYVTGDPAFAVDRSGVIVLWNAAAEKAFGYETAAALGQKCWRLLSGQNTHNNRYCGRHCPLREMAFLHEPISGFQSTFKTASDQLKPFTVSCLTVFNQPGSDILLHTCRPENKTLEAGNFRVPSGTPANNQAGTLSKREIEVLSLLADKLSTEKIAATMSISTRTVRTHIQHLMYKLQVHKRREAIRVGKRLELI
jgi:DNA-binding CsgD family transcriptional regulator